MDVIMNQVKRMNFSSLIDEKIPQHKLDREIARYIQIVLNENNLELTNDNILNAFFIFREELSQLN